MLLKNKSDCVGGQLRVHRFHIRTIIIRVMTHKLFHPSDRSYFSYSSDTTFDELGGQE